MHSMFLLVPVLFPLIGGAALGLIKTEKRRCRGAFVMAITLLNSLCVGMLFAFPPEGSAVLFKLAGHLAITFRMDGCSSVFAGLIAVLWPLASLYALEYMEHEGRERGFFAFYTMTYGITLGIAFAGNLMTMYMFYEMLTLVTIPLMMHGLDYKSVESTRKYVRYSIGGAAFAFIGFIAIVVFGDTLEFRFGGVISDAGGHETLLRIVYVIAVLGFGVKAAIFPFHGWLPSASVAPTPVTALLHAVAVVKAGAFAILRITYYSFGTKLIRGSWAQYTVMCFALVTMLYGAVKAVKEQHCKRRLAYSTVSNLSYIIFAASLMTEAGMTAAFAHLLFHGLMKITMFYCIGAVMIKAGRRYVWEMDGMGRKMPFIMAVYTVAGLSLIGIPPMVGFVSKWYIGEAAVSAGTPWSYAGLGVLIVSALLSAAYVLEVVVRTWLPRRAEETASGNEVSSENSVSSSENGDAVSTDAVPESESAAPAEHPVEKAGWRMCLPLGVLTVMIVAVGILSTSVVDLLWEVAQGIR